MAAEPDARPELLKKLDERRNRHQQRGFLARAGVVVLGTLLVAIGIVLSGPGVPGPGIAVIILGLSFLALEFDRAEWLLEKALLAAEGARRRAQNASPAQKALSALAAVLVVAGAVTAAMLWDIPVLPV